MKWKLLAGGIFGGVSLGVVVVLILVLALVVAAVGGAWWFFTDDEPLLYYDARPATVDDGTLEASGYERVNDTAFEMEWNPIPGGKGIAVRTWSTLYVKGAPGSSTGSGDPGSPGEGESFDPSNVSMVAVFSTSALQLGPVAFNPLVYASDPGLLDASGALIDEFETWLPKEVGEVTDVGVESSREVTMMGSDTEMTTFTGELVLENDATGESETVEVRMYLARTVVDGELVIALGMGPPDERTAGEFATLVGGIEMGDWDAEPQVVVTELDDENANESAGRSVVAP